MRKILFIFIFCFAVSSISGFASSIQDPPPPSSGGPVGTPPPPVGLPIDTGLSVLLLSGIGLGVFFLRKKTS